MRSVPCADERAGGQLVGLRVGTVIRTMNDTDMNATRAYIHAAISVCEASFVRAT